MAAKSLRLTSSSTRAPEESFEVEVHQFANGQMFQRYVSTSAEVESYWLSGGRYLFHGIDEKKFPHPVGFDGRQTFILPMMILRTFSLFGLCDVPAEREFQGPVALAIHPPNIPGTLNVEGNVTRVSATVVKFSLRYTAGSPVALTGSFDYNPPPLPLEAPVLNWNYLLPGDRLLSAKRTNATMRTLGEFIEGTNP